MAKTCCLLSGTSITDTLARARIELSRHTQDDTNQRFVIFVYYTLFTENKKEPTTNLGDI